MRGKANSNNRPSALRRGFRQAQGLPGKMPVGKKPITKLAPLEADILFNKGHFSKALSQNKLIDGDFFSQIAFTLLGHDPSLKEYQSKAMAIMVEEKALELWQHYLKNPFNHADLLYKDKQDTNVVQLLTQSIKLLQTLQQRKSNLGQDFKFPEYTSQMIEYAAGAFDKDPGPEGWFFMKDVFETFKPADNYEMALALTARSYSFLEKLSFDKNFYGKPATIDIWRNYILKDTRAGLADQVYLTVLWKEQLQEVVKRLKKGEIVHGWAWEVLENGNKVSKWDESAQDEALNVLCLTTQSQKYFSDKQLEIIVEILTNSQESLTSEDIKHLRRVLKIKPPFFKKHKLTPRTEHIDYLLRAKS